MDLKRNIFGRTCTTMLVRNTPMRNTHENSKLRGISQLFLGVTLLLIIPLFIPSPTSAAMSEIQERFKIERIKGKNAWFNTTGNFSKRKLKKGKILTIGDTIFTTAKTIVRISLPDGSMIKVGANTTFKITEVEGSSNFWQWTFQLLNGTVRALIKRATSNLDNKPKVRIKTPAGTAGVRGTDYTINYSADKQEVNVRVNEGSVWLAPPEARSFNKKNVGTELLIKGYCSKAKVGQAAEPAKSCSKDSIPGAKDSGVYDGKMKTGPSRLPKLKLKVNNHSGKALAIQKTISAESGNSDGKSTQGRNEGGIGKVTEYDPNKPKKNSKKDRRVTIKTLSAVLLKAIKLGDKSSAVGAIDLGADVNVQDSHGNTPLMYAAMKGRDVLILALIRAGASIDMQNRKGYTALMFAAKSGSINTVTTLKLGNPNIQLVNKFDETAQDITHKRKGKTGKLIYNELYRWRNSP